MKSSVKKCSFFFSFVMILCLLLTGCQKEQKRSEDETAGGSEASVSGFASGDGNTIVSAEGGVYLFPQINASYGFLYYWNFDQNICVPLCGKANCAHSDKDCNAYVRSPQIATLQKYEEDLYVWDSYGTLYRIKADGSGREQVCKFQAEDRSGGTPEKSIIVDDECYVNVSYGQDKNGSDVNGVYRVSLDTGEAELISMNNDDEEWVEHRMYDLTVEKGKVYYRITEYRPGEVRSRIFAYDM